MTSTEFINEFDILYNQIGSNKAPNIDSYELSVLLTKAQEQLVLNYYNPLGNKYLEGFDNSEKRKQDLKQLVKAYTADTDSITIAGTTASISGIKVYSVVIPEDTFFIVQEEALLDVTEEDAGKYCPVIPVTHDEIMLQKDNPYRRPVQNALYKRIWRVDNDVNVELGNSVELMIPSNSVLNSYNIRYVKKPRPIIVANLNEGIFEGQGLSIDGIIEETECELNDIVQRRILDRAVSIALEAYEQGRIQSYPQTTAARNE